LSCITISISIASVYCMFTAINHEPLCLWARDWSIHCMLACVMSCHVRWWYGMVWSRMKESWSMHEHVMAYNGGITLS
jgi:hypothetical protein